MFKTYYRIYRDRYAGYEVCAWRWWWPFWIQVNVANTHSSEEKAINWLKRIVNEPRGKVRDIKPEELE